MAQTHLNCSPRWGLGSGKQEQQTLPPTALSDSPLRPKSDRRQRRSWRRHRQKKQMVVPNWTQAALELKIHLQNQMTCPGYPRPCADTPYRSTGRGGRTRHCLSASSTDIGRSVGWGANLHTPTKCNSNPEQTILPKWECKRCEIRRSGLSRPNTLLNETNGLSRADTPLIEPKRLEHTNRLCQPTGPHKLRTRLCALEKVLPL